MFILPLDHLASFISYRQTFLFPAFKIVRHPSSPKPLSNDMIITTLIKLYQTHRWSFVLACRHYDTVYVTHILPQILLWHVCLQYWSKFAGDKFVGNIKANSYTSDVALARNNHTCTFPPQNISNNVLVATEMFVCGLAYLAVEFDYRRIMTSAPTHSMKRWGFFWGFFFSYSVKWYY